MCLVGIGTFFRGKLVYIYIFTYTFIPSVNLRAKAVEQFGLEEDISLFKRSLFEGTELFVGGVCVGFWNLGCRSCRTKRVDMMFFFGDVCNDDYCYHYCDGCCIIIVI